MGRVIEWVIGRSSLTARLLLILALALAPTIALLIDRTVGAQADDDRTRLDLLRAQARQIAENVSRLIGEDERMLATLSDSYTLPFADRAACDQQLRRIWRRHQDRNTHISFLDREGTLRCTSFEGAVPAIAFAERPYIRAALGTGALAVSAVQTGGVVGKPVLLLGYPWRDDAGTTRGVVITATLLQTFLDGALRTSPQIGAVGIVDADSKITPAGASPGITLPATLPLAGFDPARRSTNRVGEGKTAALLVYEPLSTWRMGIVLATPLAAVTGHGREFGVVVIQIALLCLLAGIGLWLGLRLMVIRPMHRFEEQIGRYKPGTGAVIGPPRPSDPPELISLNTAFRSMAERCDALVAEKNDLLQTKDLLIREVHHRVKNNLQIVSSLLSLQADRIREPQTRAQFETARDRIAILALLHKQLYEQGRMESTEAGQFLRQLTQQIASGMSAAGRKISINSQIEDVTLPTELAIPLGFITTELLTNAFKYAFPAGRSGAVTVQFNVAGDETGKHGTLSVQDDGVGLGSVKLTGLGSVLVEGFAAQLRGKIEIAEQAGTRITLTFPIPAGSPAAKPNALPVSPVQS